MSGAELPAAPTSIVVADDAGQKGRAAALVPVVSIRLIARHRLRVFVELETATGKSC